eukprot:TRINITY_DN67475_c7_g1_i1.p1 TRINITY_DN67475_c7_g1~~TRINITY_DN67475_c7_g1_i1.p1  ORF type:complete len:198 (+),score=6.30 TRINITY_DN67475_c7_g1_i1:185-778(+)
MTNMSEYDKQLFASEVDFYQVNSIAIPKVGWTARLPDAGKGVFSISDDTAVLTVMGHYAGELLHTATITGPNGVLQWTVAAKLAATPTWGGLVGVSPGPTPTWAHATMVGMRDGQIYHREKPEPFVEWPPESSVHTVTCTLNKAAGTFTAVAMGQTKTIKLDLARKQSYVPCVSLGWAKGMEFHVYEPTSAMAGPEA